MKNSTKPLKIAIVSDAIYPYNIGGKEKRIYEVSKRLAARGHHVTIYTMKWWKGKNTRLVHEGVVHEAISPYYPLYTGERRSMSEAIWFALHCFALFTKNFDVIEVDHMPHLILFPLKFVTLVKRKKLHVTWNEVWGKNYWKQYLGKLGLLAYCIERLSVRLPDRFIAISKHTAEGLKKEFNVTKPIFVIPNGIDIKAMRLVKASTVHSDVIYTGRLLEHKNVDRLVLAIAKLVKNYPGITCRIVGNGPELNKLKLLTKNLKLEKHVLFHDFLSENNDIFAMIKSSKTFVLPSSREGFGLVAIEAQSLGVPVITYNYSSNASRELIKEGTNGYLFNKQDSPLETTISQALKKRHNKEKIAATANEYDWGYITEKVEEVYRA